MTNITPAIFSIKSIHEKKGDGNTCSRCFSVKVTFTVHKDYNFDLDLNVTADNYACVPSAVKLELKKISKSIQEGTMYLSDSL